MTTFRDLREQQVIIFLTRHGPVTIETLEKAIPGDIGGKAENVARRLIKEGRIEERLLITLDPDDVLAALIDLQDGNATAGEQFDWNQDWVHGYAARDVAGVLRAHPGHGSVTWNQVFPVLEELANASKVIRVQLGRIPVYRTAGA